MPQANPRPVTQVAAAAATRRQGRPFCGLIDSVLVEGPVDFEFDGAILRGHANAAWTWMRRDLAPELFDPERDLDNDPEARQVLDASLPDLLERARASAAAAASSHEAERRLTGQLGGDEIRQRLPVILNALRCKSLLQKAQSFGRAANGIPEEAALAQALQAMPLQDKGVAALLMHALVGQMTAPGRLITAVIRIAGGPSEAAVQRSGFAPLIEAILAHAQNQMPALQMVGPFADMDLTCRAIDRFHRLIRPVNSLIELTRNGRWALVVGSLTKQVSSRVEPRLRDVTMDVNKALRRQRDSSDRLDTDQLLAALNGVYLLATIRDCRESLALNALFDQTWTQVGEALEAHIQRNLDILRQNPDDKFTSERLSTAIKMAELRFNAEYAEVLRRAKEAAERR